jgi:hypothetical protein
MAEGEPEVTGTDDKQAPFAVESENFDHVLTEFANVIANPTNAKLAKIGEIFPNLSRVEVESFRQLLTRDGLDAEIEQLINASQVDR